MHQLYVTVCFTSPNDTRKETVLPVTEGNWSTKCHMIHHKSYVDCYRIELSKPKTFENCRNPSHNPAHKHGKRKDFSVLCNEGQHHEPHDIMDVHWKFSSPHCAHKVGIWTKKVANDFETIISTKSLIVQTQLSLITPWSRVLLGNLTGSLVVKKFPEFYGTRYFITAFTCPHKMSQSWFRSIQSMSLNPTSWSSILIVSFLLCLGLPSVLLPLGLPTTPTQYTPHLSPMHAACPVHLIHHLISWIFGENRP